MQKYLRLLTAPVCILIIFLILGQIWKLFHFPPQEELIPIVKSFFDVYGVLVVLVAAIIESAFVFGVYAPGGLVIFLGVIFSIGNPYQAIFVVISAIVGFLIGFTIDFYIGKFGWYRLLLHFGFEKILERTKIRAEKYRLSTPWLFYHHPDTGSFLATTYGILNFSYKTFFLKTLPPVIVWCTFWGLLAYKIGMSIMSAMGYKTLVIILLVWVIARIIEVKFFNDPDAHTGHSEGSL